MLKELLILTIFAAFITAANAMTEEQDAYLQGFEDGWHLLYLRISDIDTFNIAVQEYNDELNSSLNESEAYEHLLAFAQPVQYELPPIFRGL